MEGLAARDYSEKVALETYERIFDEGRRKVRAWAKADTAPPR
jgi:hypothetical protein